MCKWEGIFKYDESAPSCLIRDYNVVIANKYGPCSERQTKGERTGRLSRRGYWEVSYSGFLYKAHRIIWEMHHGDIPPNMVVDHIDGNRGNNRIDNLRLVTSKGNAQNSGKRSHNKTGYVGVTYYKNSKGFVDGYRATWSDPCGKGRFKYFSFSKHSEEDALRLAVEYRKQKIESLNRQGEGYTERHIGD